MTISVGVIGAGFMGTNHARVLSQLPHVSLAVIVDDEIDRARALASEYGCRFGSTLDEVGEIDAVVVATPTPTHHDLAVDALNRGLHTLVEKPLAETVAEGEAILEAAEAAGRLLAVGHIERYNPVCLDLPRYISDPLFVQTRRISPFVERVKESVVLDMMIHDVDIVLWLAGDAPQFVSAQVSARRSQTEDLATVTLMFESGLVAQLTAARFGQDKVRQLDVYQHDSLVNVDLLRQDITIRRQASAAFLPSPVLRQKQASVVEIPYLEHRGEPLWLELTDFVNCIGQGQRPLVDGRSGLEALRTCEMINQAARPD